MVQQPVTRVHLACNIHSGNKQVAFKQEPPSLNMGRGFTFPTRLLLPLPQSIPLLCHRPYPTKLPSYAPPTLSKCSCSLTPAQPIQELVNYKEAFSRRMEMAGLLPHHRIAIGVSGGPDSMALCVLTADWKLDGTNGVGKSGGFIDGLLAIVVDHGLRAESNEEANVVSRRVSEMGIRCEIACCSWLDGRPKQGHLQEAAREMRYQMFQKVCTKHQIGVLLIAHHADDQAELFILRLSRNSGVLGLSGMAFTSQMFSSCTNLCEGSQIEGILVVRPLLQFSKEDMYKICQNGGQDWLEDPTNQSSLYARNRIRISLGNLSSSIFRSELQAVISACQKTRAYIDHITHNLLNQVVTVMDEGYAIIDLVILNPSQVPAMCLSKFATLVLQFISQRSRPVRGHTSKLVLDYLFTSPCKTSLTAAGCYICPAPGSKGNKILVCCSVNCPLPSTMDLYHLHPNGEQKQHYSSDLEQIIAYGKSLCDHFVPDVTDVHFLDATSESVLIEAKKLNLISESTYRNILQLQRAEIECFKSKDKVEYKSNSKIPPNAAVSSEPLQPGQTCHFMNRFLVAWQQNRHDTVNTIFEGGETNGDSGGCRIGNDVVVRVRCMMQSDWLYIAKLAKHPGLNSLPQRRVHINNKDTSKIEMRNGELDDDLKLPAQRALSLLKAIPAAARKSLPVLVSCEGQLLSIPVIGFNYCSCLRASCSFKPRMPLGGGHHSFL